MSRLEVSRCKYNGVNIFIIGEIHTHQPEVRPNIYDICMNIINEYYIDQVLFETVKNSYNSEKLFLLSKEFNMIMYEVDPRKDFIDKNQNKEIFYTNTISKELGEYVYENVMKRDYIPTNPEIISYLNASNYNPNVSNIYFIRDLLMDFVDYNIFKAINYSPRNTIILVGKKHYKNLIRNYFKNNIKVDYTYLNTEYPELPGIINLHRYNLNPKSIEIYENLND